MSKTKTEKKYLTSAEMAAKLRPTITEKDDVLEVPAEEYYAHGDSEGLAKEVLDHVEDFSGRYAGAVVRALGEAALDIMTNASDVTSVNTAASIGGRSLEMRVDRERTMPTPAGETVTVHGTASVKISEGHPEIKKARGEIKKAAAALWGKKE